MTGCTYIFSWYEKSWLDIKRKHRVIQSLTFWSTKLREREDWLRKSTWSLDFDFRLKSWFLLQFKDYWGFLFKFASGEDFKSIKDIIEVFLYRIILEIEGVQLFRRKISHSLPWVYKWGDLSSALLKSIETDLLVHGSFSLAQKCLKAKSYANHFSKNLITSPFLKIFARAFETFEAFFLFATSLVV